MVPANVIKRVMPTMRRHRRATQVDLILPVSRYPPDLPVFSVVPPQLAADNLGEYRRKLRRHGNHSPLETL